MTVQELAIEDVKFIGSSVQPRLAGALGMDAAGRRQLADTMRLFDPPGPDGRSALQASVDGLADGSDQAVKDAWAEVTAIMDAANGAANRVAVTGMETKSLAQYLAGTSAAAGVIQAGAFSAGVQESLGAPGAADAIRKSSTTGSGDALVNPALAAGNRVGNLALVGAGLALVVAGVALAWYLTR